MPSTDNKWDKRYIELAKFVSQWSKDPSTQTGAVIADRNRRIVSVGYNGFARGVHDTPERLNNREIKYKMVVHCERNAIIFARQDLSNCILYCWPWLTCSVCASLVIQAGIAEVVHPNATNERWAEEFKLAREQYSEAGILVRAIDI